MQWLKLSLHGKLEIAGFVPRSDIHVSNKQNIPRSLVKDQYCGEPPWPRGSVIDLGPPGLEFRILCLKGSVILFISPSSSSLDPI